MLTSNLTDKSNHNNSLFITRFSSNTKNVSNYEFHDFFICLLFYHSFYPFWIDMFHNSQKWCILCFPILFYSFIQKVYPFIAFHLNNYLFICPNLFSSSVIDPTLNAPAFFNTVFMFFAVLGNFLSHLHLLWWFRTLAIYTVYKKKITDRSKDAEYWKLPNENDE